MSKRILLLAFVIFVLAAPIQLGAAKTYHAERFDVDWSLTEDGVLQAIETVVFRFEGGPFTYVYRELPDDYSDGIADIEASMDGQRMPTGSQPGQVEIDPGSTTEVRWHFSPISDATHTFQLKYRVLGVVRQEENSDLFWWNALPTEYEYEIASSTVRLMYPPSLLPSGAPEVRRGTAAVEQEPGQVIWRSQNLKSDTPLTVALSFPKGSLIAAPPDWQARAQSIREAAPGFLTASGVALAAGLAWLGSLGRRGRRRETAVTPVALRSSTLPDLLPPAAAGTLAAGNGKPGATQAIGVLFSLAQRGILGIEESHEKHWYRSREYDVHLLDPAPRDLRPHEQGLLDLLFENKTGRSQAVKLSEVGTRLTNNLKRFSEPLTAELISDGFIDLQRQATGKRFMILGVIFVLLALPLAGLAALFAREFGGWPFLFVAVSFVLGIVALIMSASYSPLSDEGARTAARWQRFQSYLKDVIREREPAWDLTLFDRYLPYAAALGLVEGWAKAFRKRGGAEIPAWFRAVASGDDGGVAAFVAMTTAVNSTGSAAGGGAGGGGAGGGGGSGAG